MILEGIWTTLTLGRLTILGRLSYGFIAAGRRDPRWCAARTSHSGRPAQTWQSGARRVSRMREDGLACIPVGIAHILFANRRYRRLEIG
jgi:hypothetical protein